MSKRVMFVGAVLVAISGARLSAQIVYVDADATGANDGSTWCDAYVHLQDGLADAAGSGGAVTEIRVAEGTYRPDRNTANPDGTGDRTATFQLLNGVALRGGYAGCGEPDPDERDIDAHETVLSGDLDVDDGPDFANNGENSYHIVTGSGTDDTAILDGFTVTGGNANGGGEFTDDSGGGMSNHIGNPSVYNCTFSMNFANHSGGAMHNDRSHTSLIKCKFLHNVALVNAGGVYNNTTAHPTLVNCIFVGNQAFRGGGRVEQRYEPSGVH